MTQNAKPAALDETMYEFAQENEAMQSMDDIDAFEARLAGGGGQQRAPVRKQAPPPMRKLQAPPMRSGKDYVESSKQQQRRKPAKPAGADKDDAEEFETAKKAMSDLDKFDAQYGGSDDEY